MKTLKKCLAMFLAILTLFSICSLSTTVFAAEYTEQKARTEYFDSALSGYLKNIVDTEDAVSISEKERVDQAVEEVKNSIASTSSTFSLRTASVQGTEETETAKEVAEELDIDHTRLTLELEDGENVAYLFSEPVSYLDEDGNIVYKDTDIISVTESSLLSDGYLYENADNNYKVYFGEDSSVGILLCSDKGSKISLIPNGANIVPGYVSSKKVDEIQTPVFEYDGVYGVNSLLRYTPQLNGCKEEIILSAYERSLRPTTLTEFLSDSATGQAADRSSAMVQQYATQASTSQTSSTSHTLTRLQSGISDVTHITTTRS